MQENTSIVHLKLYIFHLTSILSYPSVIFPLHGLLFKVGQGPFYSQHCLFSVCQQFTDI